MNDYVVIQILTDKGEIWDVRKKGRILYREIGKFKTCREAEDAAAEDAGGHGHCVSYTTVDRRSHKGFFVWVLEYHTFVGGQYRKEREEYLTRWEARLHKWLYSFDKTKLRFRIEREERGV